MEKLKRSAESLVILALGLFFLISSCRIDSNPIKYSGWTGVLAQAKFTPIIMSIGICILGLVLFSKQFRGMDKSATLERHEIIRLACMTVIVACYLISIFYFKFTIPTIVYAFVSIFFLNWGSRKIPYMIVTAVLAIVLGLYALPLLINLRLP